MSKPALKPFLVRQKICVGLHVEERRSVDRSMRATRIKTRARYIREASAACAALVLGRTLSETPDWFQAVLVTRLEDAFSSAVDRPTPGQRAVFLNILDALGLHDG